MLLNGQLLFIIDIKWIELALTWNKAVKRATNCYLPLSINQSSGRKPLIAAISGSQQFRAPVLHNQLLHHQSSIIIQSTKNNNNNNQNQTTLLPILALSNVVSWEQSGQVALMADPLIEAQKMGWYWVTRKRKAILLLR